MRERWLEDTNTLAMCLQTWKQEVAKVRNANPSRYTVRPGTQGRTLSGM
jgi:hypothetical protein